MHAEEYGCYLYIILAMPEHQRPAHGQVARCRRPSPMFWVCMNWTWHCSGGPYVNRTGIIHRTKVLR
jgi:hypothetical protein